MPIPQLSAPDLALALAFAGKSNARVVRADYFVPPAGKGAEILAGSREEVIEKLLDLLKTKGGLN